MKKQNKRNIKKNRKRIIRKTDLQKIQNSGIVKKTKIKETIKLNDSYPQNLKRNATDLLFDSASDSISKKITYNWMNYGIPNLNSKVGETYAEISNSKKYNSKMFLEFGTEGKFYHLTSPKNWYKIRKKGLKSVGVNRTTSMGCDGKIWSIESNRSEIWNYIGYNQLSVGVENLPIVVIEIDKKVITGKLTSEDGNDFPTLLHTVINQDKISPEYLKKVGVFYTKRQLYYDLRPTLKRLKYDFYNSPGKNTMFFKIAS